MNNGQKLTNEQLQKVTGGIFWFGDQPTTGNHPIFINPLKLTV